MMRKCHVRFGGGPGEKAVMTSLAVYPTLPSCFPISASFLRSPSLRRIRPLICVRRIRFSVTKYSFRRRIFLIHRSGDICEQYRPVYTLLRLNFVNLCAW